MVILYNRTVVHLSRLYEPLFIRWQSKAHFSRVVDDCEKADIIITKTESSRQPLDYGKYVLLNKFLGSMTCILWMKMK